MKSKGFTLLEILIAIAIFAIIASITSSILYQTLQVKENSTEQISKINELQLALSILTQDIKQIIERPIRGNKMHLFPSFIGQNDYLEFTRGGNTNPNAYENRSTLIRVAYLCKNRKLIRRIWSELDTPDRERYQNTVILKDLKKCEFAYVGMHQNIMPTWYQYTTKRNNEDITNPLPEAVQLILNQEHLGLIKLNFIVS